MPSSASPKARFPPCRATNCKASSRTNSATFCTAICGSICGLMGVVFGVAALGYIGHSILRNALFFGLARRDGGRGALAFAAIGGGLAVLGFVGVLGGNLIRAAISRQREYLADASAVQYTRNPQGIGGALVKLASTGGVIASPKAVECGHLLFEDGLARGFFNPFATHPPIRKRIKKVLPQWDGELPAPAPAMRRRRQIPRPLHTRPPPLPPVSPRPVFPPPRIFMSTAIRPRRASAKTTRTRARMRGDFCANSIRKSPPPPPIRLAPAPSSMRCCSIAKTPLAARAKSIICAAPPIPPFSRCSKQSSPPSPPRRPRIACRWSIFACRLCAACRPRRRRFSNRISPSSSKPTKRSNSSNGARKRSQSPASRRAARDSPSNLSPPPPPPRFRCSPAPAAKRRRARRLRSRAARLGQKTRFLRRAFSSRFFARGVFFFARGRRAAQTRARQSRRRMRRPRRSRRHRKRRIAARFRLDSRLPDAAFRISRGGRRRRDGGGASHRGFAVARARMRQNRFFGFRHPHLQPARLRPRRARKLSAPRRFFRRRAARAFFGDEPRPLGNGANRRSVWRDSARRAIGCESKAKSASRKTNRRGGESTAGDARAPRSRGGACGGFFAPAPNRRGIFCAGILC